LSESPCPQFEEVARSYSSFSQYSTAVEYWENEE
jgi:hypothetical protein